MARKKTVQVVRRGSGEVLIPAARPCNNFFTRVRGLQFRRRLGPGEALILSKERDSIAGSSIHMFFVFFPIAAIWVNRQGRVTAAQLAEPWRPYYASPEPAATVIEARPEVLERIRVGDELEFK